MNQSDIVLTPVSKGPKNITWRKVLAMVLLLAFVIALVVTLILLLQKDGLYKKLSVIRVKIELSKNVDSHIDDLFDKWFILLHVHILTFIHIARLFKSRNKSAVHILLFVFLQRLRSH